MPRRRILLIFLVLVISGTASARSNTPERRKGQQVERTVAADARVIVSACVVSGSLTVQSWDRNEVRARITDGVQIELTRTDQTKSKAAGELKLTASEARPTKRSSCLMYGEIELNVPRGASLKLQTNSGDIRVTDVARVSAVSTGGNVFLSRMRDEVNVNTIGGEISVRDSKGAFKLHSVGGSIEVHNLSEMTATDVFEASTTGGDLTLARIEHKRLRVNTVSGEVNYAGPLVRGGRYSFQSFSGMLRLSLPADSSFRLSGSLGTGGDLTSDFDLKDNPRSAHPGSMRRLFAVVGSGDATLNISLFSGSVQIRKQ